MRAFLGNVLVISVAFLLAQNASRGEVFSTLVEEQDAWLHPVWQPIKACDGWAQKVLDAFLAQSAARLPFPPARKIMIIGSVGDDPLAELTEKRARLLSGGSLTILDPEEERVPHRLKIVVREVGDDDSGVGFAVVRKNTLEETAVSEAVDALDDLRYGFIYTPLGNPLTSYERPPPEHELNFDSLWFCYPFSQLSDEEKTHWRMIHERRRRQLIASRAIVTRECGTKMPTWASECPAFIVEPAFWYFDPDSRVWKMELAWWQFSLNTVKENATARRNMAEFVFEDYKCLKNLNRPPSYGSTMLFR
jgi:hypothetical protein